MSFEYLDLAPIARSMGRTCAELARLAARDQFAPVLRLTERSYVVRRRDLEAWEQRAEISAARSAHLAGHLDETPAEPFAEVPQ